MPPRSPSAARTAAFEGSSNTSDRKFRRIRPSAELTQTRRFSRDPPLLSAVVDLGHEPAFCFRDEHLGFRRIVASEMEIPNLLVNLV